MTFWSRDARRLSQETTSRPKRVLTFVLPDKPVERAAQIGAGFTAFECPHEYVVGCGLDLAHRFRELPFVGRLARTLEQRSLG